MKRPNSYSDAEWESCQAALDKGCNIPQNYPLPYSVETIPNLFMDHPAIINRLWIPFEDGETVFMDGERKLPKVLYRVLAGNEVPMSDFFHCKRKARKFTEQFNIRHFKVMAMSSNPLMPVLL